MYIESVIVLAVIAFVIVFLYKEWLRPGLVFVAGIMVLLVGDLVLGGDGKEAVILTPKQALDGFANEQLAIIIFLLMISNILRKSAGIDQLFRGFLRTKDKPQPFLAKMTSGVGIFSAFLNNTPLVAMLMPYVYDWCKENRYSPSKFLIPLSYASILGGCITLIGTSTMLIANSIAVKLGATPLELFDPTPVGVAMFIIGVVYLVLFSGKLLPDRKRLQVDNKETDRQYFLETYVTKGSALIGKSIEEAGLRNLDGLFLIEIIRDGKAIRPVTPQEILQTNDMLFFAGDVNAISKLDTEALGISLPRATDFLDSGERQVVEVVISHNSLLNGRTVKEINFRGRFDGAVVAIHRNGEKVWGQLGKIKLRSGDVLLVLAGKDFMSRVQSGQDFYVISNYKEEAQIPDTRIYLVFFGLIAAISLAALKLVPLFISLLLLIVGSLVAKLIRVREIRNSIDYNLILIIGMGLALGKAMENTGTSEWISSVVLSLGHGWHPAVYLTLLFLITNLLSSVITSKAAVAVLLPVSLELARGLELIDVPFILIIAFAGSANFITPIGYQTNLMVFGPGGYKFKDFLRVGLPLTLFYMLVTVSILTWTFNLS